MEFDRYQKDAVRTDRVPLAEGADDRRSLMVPMLGLAGEAGQLLSEYQEVSARRRSARTLRGARVRGAGRPPLVHRKRREQVRP